MSHVHDLRERIDRLESLDGEGTELVTVTVPPSKSMKSVRERIAQERASAENIKSDQTKERVQRALERMHRILRRYPETPEHGLVAYAGVVDGELVSAVFDDLPTPVTEYQYRCDDHFDATPLADAIAPGETFGLVVVERGAAAIGRLVGDRVVPVRTLESQVMGKTRAGGQSAQRFARERERQEHEFFQEVAELAADAFVGEDETVTGLVVGGTLATAKRFADDEYLCAQLRDRLIGTYAVEYATAQGLDQLVEKAADRLLEAERRERRERLDQFFAGLRDGDTVAYGIEDVDRAIEFGAVETALLASTLPRERRTELERAVTRQGGDVFVISNETERGARLADTFGQVGALLRFPVR